MNKYEVATMIASLLAAVVIFLCPVPETANATLRIIGLGSGTWIIAFSLVLVEVNHRE